VKPWVCFQNHQSPGGAKEPLFSAAIPSPKPKKLMETRPDQPNDLEELLTLNPKKYSFWTDMQLNGWLATSMMAIVVGDLWLFNHEDCPFFLRVIIALVPPAMWLLWIRNVAQWMRGLDELQRRIALEAHVFAIISAFFVIATLRHLKHEGILKVIFRSSHSFLGKLALGFNLGGNITEYDCLFPLSVMLFISFLILGYKIFNRRYK
jgi:hypothetical protein